MKKIIAIIFVLFGIITVKAQNSEKLPEEKTAILMVHFGTTFDDTRALTIDAINQKVKETFPKANVLEAYTSRIIINRLKKRGISKPTPQEALLRLAADGYTHVIVQGTNVIDGVEAEVLRNEAALMAHFFEEIRVGRPLLYSVNDCEAVAKILSSRYENATAKNGAVVLIGHGTSTPANAIYSQMDYIFTSIGNPSFHVATVEGYPTMETTVRRLKEARSKSVTLIPFMFVAGDHARNDIDGEWRDELTKMGFSISSILEGLGQIPAIQDIYIQHIKDAFYAPVPDASKQKATYIKENM
ncbi:MAG: sirohydrochlorin cobaltochelatase [Muribaculaceae bacterium]|nr:sirohydrochlorin cobaltochelatase [Lachnospiraceae bacterium]MCM1295548.1 sirohydrochlorin cobaltochelatase [Muribaculaceae bacterium]